MRRPSRVWLGTACDAPARECGAEFFPRLDPAVIVLVSDDDHALLGRQSTWPPGRYSALAGFVEAGESLEDAVVREVREETGVRASAVSYFASQPWPFPSSLMLGFQATADRREPLQLDGELEDARWFKRRGARGNRGCAVLPPPYSIARRLIDAWYSRATGCSARRGAVTPGTLELPGTPMPMTRRRKSPRAHIGLGVVALLCVCVHASPAAAAIRVEVSGVDSTLRRNVLALLSVEHYKDRDRIEPDAVARLFRRVNDEVSDALKPYGYYAPTIQPKLTSEDNGRNWLVQIDITAGRAGVARHHQRDCARRRCQ